VVQARQDVQRLRAQLADVEGQIKAFQARVEAAPKREQEILSLTRDYEELRDNYSSLVKKKMEAEMASKLEQEARGRQFRVIDPAYLPEQPSFPNRPLFALMGALMGVAAGVGLAIGADFIDPTIKDVDDLGAVLPYPVLAVISHVKPKHQRQLARHPEEPIAGRPTARQADDEDSGARRPGRARGGGRNAS